MALHTMAPNFLFSVPVFQQLVLARACCQILSKTRELFWISTFVVHEFKNKIITRSLLTLTLFFCSFFCPVAHSLRNIKLVAACISEAITHSLVFWKTLLQSVVLMQEWWWLFRSQPAEGTTVMIVWWNISHERRGEGGGCPWEDAGLLRVAVPLLGEFALSLRYMWLALLD